MTRGIIGNRPRRAKKCLSLERGASGKGSAGRTVDPEGRKREGKDKPEKGKYGARTTRGGPYLKILLILD